MAEYDPHGNSLYGHELHTNRQRNRYFAIRGEKVSQHLPDLRPSPRFSESATFSTPFATSESDKELVHDFLIHQCGIAP